jgi:membrane peptidoglycan carboxypeptidase
MAKERGGAGAAPKKPKAGKPAPGPKTIAFKRKLRRPGCLGWSVRAVLLGSLATAAAGLLATLVVLGLYKYYIVDHPGPEFEPDAVRRIISQESPVYYRDGITPVGVFFENEHRVYVPWADLPRGWVVSIVAAEDAAFWSHPGISAKHIVRAMRDNLLAGGVVAGGSTLSQQTAKNLFYRQDRSLKSKGMEFVNALRLEAQFDKTEILTFYANQFHVTGNGRGFGIAARHFFDKEPEELNLVECAFLAGLVKAPAYYDPFLGDEDRRKAAIARATTRTTYVLSRIAEESPEALAGPYPHRGDATGQAAFEARVAEVRKLQTEARHLLADGFEIPFRRGTFRYESSAVLDEVARRLAEPPFVEILGEKGFDPASGLVVVTTLDAGAEREASWALWHHLTEVGIELEVRSAGDLVAKDVKPPRFDPDFPPSRHEFRYGAVAEVREPEGKKHLALDLGGHTCVVDRDGIVRIATAIHRGEKKSASAKPSTAAVDALVDALPVGSVVWASVRAVPTGGTALCDLELRPELQGSVVVMDHGQIRAMVGGNDNRNFNRATALRQFGSTWKPLVYHAAQLLGWSPADLLDNRRNVFAFSGSFYWPSPDHQPADQVSMAWAGVNSENLASVWLLYHLTDRLDHEQMRRLAASLDLVQRPDEPLEAYRTRIQKLGVLPTPARVAEQAYLRARHEVLNTLSYTAHPEDELALRTMPYGWGYGAERGRTSDPVRVAALQNAWDWTEPRVAACGTQWATLADALVRGEMPDLALVPDLKLRTDITPWGVACGGPAMAGWSSVSDMAGAFPGAQPEPEPEPIAAPEPLPDPAPRRGLFGGGQRGGQEPDPAPDRPRRNPRPARISGPPIAPLDDLWIDGRLHYGTASAVRTAIERQRAVWEVAGAPDLYDPELLYWHQDFRVLVALKYLAALAADYGVSSEIQPVLSLPLGASEITLEEATSLYGGLVSGEVWSFPGAAARRGQIAAPADPGLLIAEIRDGAGNVLYKARPRSQRIADPEIAALTADILRNVVRWGTGRRAATAIDAGGNPLPVGGKTGTTNDYRNAAFLGFAPVAGADGYRAADGMAVGVYVGYDDNRPLVNGGIKLAGASGALPAWIGTVAGLQSTGMLGPTPAAATTEGGVWPLIWPAELERVPAREGDGIPQPAQPFDPALPSILVPRGSLTPRIDAPHAGRTPRSHPRTDEGEGKRGKRKADGFREPGDPAEEPPER